MPGRVPPRIRFQFVLLCAQWAAACGDAVEVGEPYAESLGPAAQDDTGDTLRDPPGSNEAGAGGSPDAGPSAPASMDVEPDAMVPEAGTNDPGSDGTSDAGVEPPDPDASAPMDMDAGPGMPRPPDADSGSETSGDTDGGVPDAETPQPEPSDAGDGIDGGGFVDASVDDDAGTPRVCEPAELAPGSDEWIDLLHDGIPRRYLLHVPAAQDGGPMPLVFNWHALNSSPTQQAGWSAMSDLADQRGFIVAYPEGISRAFNGGTCCGDIAEPPHAADDLGFARAMVADIDVRLCLDTSRVYSTGLSNGGTMSEFNACHSADLFAAVAPVSSMPREQPDCSPARPIPMLAVHGTEDNVVGYDNGRRSVEQWVARNGCTGEAQLVELGPDAYCERWTECDAGAEVEHCTVANMGHCWPGSAECRFGATSDAVDASLRIWEFFERFSLPDP